MRTLLLLLTLLPAAAFADDALLSGPMLGHKTQRTTAVWVQAKRATTVQLRYHPVGKPNQARLSDPIKAVKSKQFAVTVLLDDLKEATAYAYELFLDGKKVVRPYPFTFKTQPYLRWRDPRPTVTLLAGSCTFVNEPGTGRNPRRPYGGGYGIFQTMAKHGGDAMLWLGDNVYFREVDYHSPQGLFRRYRHDRALKELQPLLAAMNHYALWDDHDFGPNNADGSYRFKHHALAAFKRYWPAPQYGLAKVPGVFQRFSLADVDVITVDGRYHRTPNRAPAGPKKLAFGKKQMQWLKHTLLNARGAFKLIVTGNQWLNRATPYESMHLYEQEVEELIGWIAKNRISGVVFVSGDRHHSELLRIKRDDVPYPLYEFTCSPLTSSAHRFGPEKQEFHNPRRVKGTLVGVRNFGVMRVEGDRRERRLVLETRDAKNTLLWSHTIRAQDVRFPRRRRGAKPPAKKKPKGKLY